MSDQGENDFIRYIYRGEEGEVIPDGATHIFVGEDITFVREFAFHAHPNIIEVIFHENVEKIERSAFSYCPKLRRVIMPGVKIVEWAAFSTSKALIYVECGKLEVIEEGAFGCCKSLGSITLPSARTVEENAFISCEALQNVKFSTKLERIDGMVFASCFSLERITLPLKDNLFTQDDIFRKCVALKHVDLVEEELLNKTIVSLQSEDWRNDMSEEIDSINQILPSARALTWDDVRWGDYDGEKTQAIRRWIRSILGKIIHYQAEHQRILDEHVAPTLQLVLPRDILMNNVLPFLELPSHTFEVQEE